MRADRLISILLLLQNNKKMTTKSLAKELEVTERTIHRDMEALSAAGIPVLAERGKHGGWRLVDQYRTKLTGLKDTELKTLFLSPSFQLLSDLGFTKDWKEARQKLLASLPTTIQSQADDMWNRVHIDTDTWRQSPQELSALSTLQHAIWEERKIKMGYEKANQQTSERIVEPLGLVAKGRTWYLIASSNGELRNFRVSRIKSSEIMDEGFARPHNFNLAEYWNQSKQTFVQNLPVFKVDVEVSPAILPRLSFTGRFGKVLSTGTPNKNGWIPVKLSFETKEEGVAYILGFGDQVRIKHPVSMINDVTKTAESVLSLYNEGLTS
ncbi:helix-turn-helix transcriptional regulator [Fictibacillus phosphorivorans]|uniref:helix-turn-helix transcriptional regulator n=1 Tax=Fictibacillus phosphorivorans TaxID=1221500 RepID=UPI00203B2C97|nr:YafY family protein [Fictibacillus phosphorivorans]MCM3718971.1 YafY family transcriptional regulator [Fictibacillus phosphorivorans]MCM3776593.1 YafY family transcriptional regulator [Fictibacillus phosphorivorans]